MKKTMIMMLILLLIVPICSLAPKNTAHAAMFSPTKIFLGFAYSIKEQREEKKQKQERIRSNSSVSTEVDKINKVDGSGSKGSAYGQGNFDLTNEMQVKAMPTFGAFEQALADVISMITMLGTFYLAFSVLRSLGMFMVSLMRFIASPAHPRMRMQISKDLFMSCMCIMLLGSVGLISNLLVGIVFG